MHSLMNHTLVLFITSSVLKVMKGRENVKVDSRPTDSIRIFRLRSGSKNMNAMINHK